MLAPFEELDPTGRRFPAVARFNRHRAIGTNCDVALHAATADVVGREVRLRSLLAQMIAFSRVAVGHFGTSREETLLT